MNEFNIKNGFKSYGNSTISGDLTVTGTIIGNISGTISGGVDTSGLSTEASTRLSSDNILSTSISTETSTRFSSDNGLSTELSQRISVDVILSSSISTETSERISSDTTLSSSLSQRVSVDTMLSSSISTETSERISSDNNLSSSLSTEISTRTAGINGSVSNDWNAKNTYISQRITVGVSTSEKSLTIYGEPGYEAIRIINNAASGSIMGSGYIGFNNWLSQTNSSAQIGAEERTNGSYLSDLIFKTRTTNADVAPSERMRVTSFGNVLIGYIYEPNADNKLFVNGGIQGSLVNGILGLSNTVPLISGTANIGDSTRVARANHVHPVFNLGSSNLTLTSNRTVSSTNLYGLSFNNLKYFKLLAQNNDLTELFSRTSELTFFPIGDTTTQFSLSTTHENGIIGSPYIHGLTDMLELGFTYTNSSKIEIKQAEIDYISNIHNFDGVVNIVPPLSNAYTNINIIHTIDGQASMIFKDTTGLTSFAIYVNQSSGDKSIYSDGYLALDATTVGVTGVLEVNTPTSDGHAASKGYVDSKIVGLTTYEPVHVATTTNIDLNGAETIDGQFLYDGIQVRVLVKNQINKYENGIYIPSPGDWSRVSDMYLNVQFKQGGFVLITNGTTQGGSSYTLSLESGTSFDVGNATWGNMTWTQFSQAGNYTNGAGLSKTGNVFSVTLPISPTSTTASIVSRNSSGNFSANIITASLSGNATTATTATSVTNASFSRQFTMKDIRTSDVNSPDNNYSLAARSTGMYAIYETGTNGPGATYLSLIHVSNYTDVAFQIAGGYNSDNMYFRGTSELQNGVGYTPWRTVWHSGNFTPTDYLLSRDFGTAASNATSDFCFVKTSANFGDNHEIITTADFISLLGLWGAFNQQHWVTRNSWSFANNQMINTNECGHIDLTGCVIEVFNDGSNKTIRVTTTPTNTGDGGIPNSEFIYVDNGIGTDAGWRKQFNTRNDGIGSGLDADLLDSVQGSDYQRKLVELIVTGGQPNYYLSSNDANKMISINYPSCSVHIPMDIFTIGTQIIFKQSDGQLLFLPDQGVYIQSAGSKFKTKELYSVCQLICTGVNIWTLFGDLTL